MSLSLLFSWPARWYKVRAIVKSVLVYFAYLYVEKNWKSYNIGTETRIYLYTEPLIMLCLMKKYISENAKCTLLVVSPFSKRLKLYLKLSQISHTSSLILFTK